MDWTGVITNAGKALLNQWVDGNTLTITQAVAGTGTVAAEALVNQTALVNQKQTGTVTAAKKDSEGRQLKINVTAPANAYTLNQLGVKAKIGTGAEVLLALFQNTTGISVPAFSDNPNFTYTIWAALEISNEGTMEITVDPTALVTQDDLQDGLAQREAITNKVTYITESSTNTEYPSAKAVYDGIMRYINLKDTETQIQYRLGIENGIMYIEDYEEES